MSLRPIEVAPETQDPLLERCILICDRCRDGIAGRPVNPQEWRFLEEVAWTDLVPLQVTAVRLLRGFAPETRWAAELLESLYLSPEASDGLSTDS